MKGKLLLERFAARFGMRKVIFIQNHISFRARSEINSDENRLRRLRGIQRKEMDADSVERFVFAAAAAVAAAVLFFIHNFCFLSRLEKLSIEFVSRSQSRFILHNLNWIMGEKITV